MSGETYRNWSITVEFTRTLTTNPTSDEERAKILQDPGFGTHYTDHQVIINWDIDKGWHSARVVPYGPVTLNPAAAVLHYGQEIFEGLKAYRHKDGGAYSFRPESNARRLNRSAVRLGMPELPVDVFLQAIKELVSADEAWIPDGDGESLYLRPFMIATEAFLGVRPSHRYEFRVIASPAGNYFGGELKPVQIWLSETYARAGHGGTGEAKCGGNYAASLIAQLEAEANECQQVIFTDPTNDHAVQELGGMNVFFVIDNGKTLVTPALDGTILHGVTRSSVLELAQEKGLAVEERTFTLGEWKQRLDEGTLDEVFACGTAAVITPISQLRGRDMTLTMPEVKHDGVWATIRHDLLGVQTGAVDDTRGWLHQLA
ncbi:branched-chain amino acid aminotransferase [Pseudoglutamicibacter albus]|uniref:branched-chain amino acid aminotransferase n=1 Tax=Pseudoglutamicibacter albus TaxID=98671 RepID=UPI0006895D25|nr:branched-chain amino acid aminotransferase [Pseudoglutamicibacter albus]